MTHFYPSSGTIADGPVGEVLLPSSDDGKKIFFSRITLLETEGERERVSRVGQ